ncbi:MAG: response regulator [Candidatus Dadabacteria bacterium]
MPTINLLIADDHEIFLDGMHVLLKKVPDIEIVGEANNGQQLVRLAKELKPDVVITDIKMPVMDGIEATKLLTQEMPEIGIIALSMYEEENLIVEMLEAGAKGYLLKNAHKTEILQAIQAVYKGQTYYCNRTSTSLVKLLVNSSFNPHRKEDKQKLSDREIDVIRLICKEMANKEIAAELNLSVRTVEGYREKIEEKINAKNAAGIVVYAIKNGIYKI